MLSGPTANTGGSRSRTTTEAFKSSSRSVVTPARTPRLPHGNAVNSLEFSTPAPSSIPNHVDADTYAAQAGGATSVVTLPDGTYETAVHEDDHLCIDLRPVGAPTGPRFCDIPANAPWPQPVITTTVELNGTRYLIGTTAADTVTGVDVDGDPVFLSARQAFPTLRFFAVPVAPDTLPIVTAHTSTGTIAITPTTT